MSDAISILYPKKENICYKSISDITIHDLGLDFICSNLTNKESEQRYLLSVLSKMTSDPGVARYRQEVFSDIYKRQDMRRRMMELLDHVRFLKDYSSLKSTHNNSKPGIFELMHRLDELDDYIKCVEGMMECLKTADVQSAGLNNLSAYLKDIYESAHFAEMKRDISKLRADTAGIRSVTLGLNLNERYEVKSVGIVSVNNTYFRSSGIVSEFADALSMKDDLKEGTKWSGDMRYHAIERETLVTIPEQDGNADATHLMDKTMNQLLNLSVKRLRNTLTQYAVVTIVNIAGLIPEFLYYIRFAEMVERLRNEGRIFCASFAENNAETQMQARGFYNLKLAFASTTSQSEIVQNDLDFDMQHMIYILTGANRGGKTTVTQAVGVLYILAQGGIDVPCESFTYVPVDSIYTHFPADEEKTMDLGRLGEECRRFKEIYSEATSDSLLLLNETFSTTSFEEGYYIAFDAVKALLKKGMRTIYNTHMHKLAYEIERLNEATDAKILASSLIVASEDGIRSFKIIVAPPVGLSYADDIAKKYGVTFEMLTES